MYYVCEPFRMEPSGDPIGHIRRKLSVPGLRRSASLCKLRVRDAATSVYNAFSEMDLTNIVSFSLKIC
jgi:hypothetical protein